MASTSAIFSTAAPSRHERLVLWSDIRDHGRRHPLWRLIPCALMARYLADKPEGVEPSDFNFQELI